MKKIINLFFCVLLCSGLLYADTHTAASLSKADIQTAIDAASAGDIVQLPAGTNDSIDGSTPITITTNDLWIRGTGSTNTIISTDNGTASTAQGIFRATSVTKLKFSDMKLDGQNLQSGNTEVLLAIHFCKDVQKYNCNFIHIPIISI